ncbi:MAG: NCS2 family permease [Bryobacteraceae bacterium]|nr:NCS2 family permease [Bryobacteraceae bacterium]
MRARLESYFEFAALHTDWRTEILAGITTFMTMAYIVFVNPSILGEAGMPVSAVTAATCISAAVGSILMGAWARYPIALAPGMGLNAYFTYSVVKGMGVAWQVALGAVFLSGVVFLLLTALGLRRLILEAIPTGLYAAVAVGIGLFIAFIGLKNAGLIAAHPATLVTLGNLRSPQPMLGLFGLLVTAGLMAWGVRASILLGILVSTAAGAAFGLVQWTPQNLAWGALPATAFQLDVPGALRLGLLEIVFVFLFVDMFDNIGTLVGVGKKAGLFDAASRIPRVERILTCDALATIAGSLTGTSTVVSYIESASGVAAGGRSGVTAVVTGLLFLVAMFLAPLVGAIPAAATAPAMILVGSMMISHAAEIDWVDPLISIPAFLTIVTIPLTFSIANGLSFGFVAYTVLRVARGEWRQVNWLVYVLAVLFVLRFAYLGAG